MNWRKSLSKISLALTLLLAACYPQGPEFVNDTDVILTNYNPAFDFKSKGTFAIPDKIVKITGNMSSGDAPVYVSAPIATPLLAQMTKNMTDLGYTKVDISASPSLMLLPAAMETTTITYWYNYWGWWYGGYYPPYWGYPYYPTVTSYSTGTLIMMLTDPTKTSGDDNPVSQWVGAANGLMSNTYDVTRVTKAIDQAFKQSPYLKH